MNYLVKTIKTNATKFFAILLIPFITMPAFATSLDDFSLSYLQILLGKLEAEESWVIEDESGEESS